MQNVPELECDHAPSVAARSTSIWAVSRVMSSAWQSASHRQTP
jgi:hypothetical protein